MTPKEYEHEIDAAMAWIKELRAKLEWQPIETAPSEIYILPLSHVVRVRDDVKYLLLWDWRKEEFVAWMPLPELPRE